MHTWYTVPLLLDNTVLNKKIHSTLVGTEVEIPGETQVSRVTLSVRFSTLRNAYEP